MSSKGQVVIPKGLRDALHWGAGTDLEVEINDEGLMLRRPARDRRLPTLEEVRKVGGTLKYDGPPLSLDEIDSRLAESFRKEWRK